MTLGRTPDEHRDRGTRSVTVRIDSDICIIGSGITAILAAERITELTTEFNELFEQATQLTYAIQTVLKKING